MDNSTYTDPEVMGNGCGGFVRRIVPLLYTSCIAVFVFDEVESWRRIRQAEAIGEVFQELPQTRAELEYALDSLMKESTVQILEDGKEEERFLRIDLHPDLGLRAWGRLDGETDFVLEAWVIWAASERIDLNDPSASLPESLCLLYAILAAVAGLLSWIWLRFCQTEPDAELKGATRDIVLMIRGVLVIPYMVIAAGITLRAAIF